MWVYLKSERSLWTVGYYDPRGRWVADSDHSSREAATERVHFLNGGRESKPDTSPFLDVDPRPAIKL